MSLLEKLSSYELPNMIIPGSLLSALLCWVLRIDVTLLNSVIGLFVFVCTAYVLGLIASRIGSLIIEPIAKSCGFIQWAKYSDYCKAEAKDQKIATLTLYANLYRTLASTGILMIICLAYEATRPTTMPIDLLAWICLILLILFSVSYRKQTRYIVKRVYNVLNKKSRGELRK